MISLILLTHWDKDMEFMMSKADLHSLYILLHSGKSVRPRKIGSYYFYYTGSCLCFNSSRSMKSIHDYNIADSVSSILAKISAALA